MSCLQSRYYLIDFQKNDCLTLMNPNKSLLHWMLQKYIV